MAAGAGIKIGSQPLWSVLSGWGVTVHGQRTPALNTLTCALTRGNVTCHEELRRQERQGESERQMGGEGGPEGGPPRARVSVAGQAGHDVCTPDSRFMCPLSSGQAGSRPSMSGPAGGQRETLVSAVVDGDHYLLPPTTPPTVATSITTDYYELPPTAATTISAIVLPPAITTGYRYYLLPLPAVAATKITSYHHL